MIYCDYCGYSYIDHKCRICSKMISTCGCDCARDVCEEHFCVECSEPYIELNEDGWCEDCITPSINHKGFTAWQIDEKNILLWVSSRIFLGYKHPALSGRYWYQGLHLSCRGGNCDYLEQLDRSARAFYEYLICEGVVSAQSFEEVAG